VVRAVLTLAAFAVAATACGEPAPPAAAAPASAGVPPIVPEYPTDDASWGKFHSKRFQLSVPLPDGRGWKIDDHGHPELVAVHPPTSSTVTLVTTQEEELMNRTRCEARARSMGWLSRPHGKEDGEGLTTVDDQVQTGPDTYDSRVWVTIDAGRPDGALEGHVFLFGASVRRCLLVHVSTRVPSAKNEGVLASRLAIASARIVNGIRIDPPRTTDSATLPRDKPEIRR
jgi:hypothetical protein